MLGRFHRAPNCLKRWILVLAFVIGVLIFITDSCWSEPKGRHGKTDTLRGQNSVEGINSQPWETSNGQDKNWIRKRRENREKHEHRPKIRFDEEHNDYNSLSEEQKERVRKKLRQWKSLPPERRKDLRRKMQRLKKLPPEDRALFRRRFNQWQQLPSEERNRIREKLRNWDTLSPQEQEEIRRRFRTP